MSEYRQLSATDIAGRRLSGVTLHLIDEEISTIKIASRILACEADLGVRLEFDDGNAAVVRWGTPGAREGILVEDAGLEAADGLMPSVSDIILASSAGSFGSRSSV